MLDWSWTLLVARIGLTLPLMVGALTKRADLGAAALERERVGIHPGLHWALLTIVVEVLVNNETAPAAGQRYGVGPGLWRSNGTEAETVLLLATRCEITDLSTTLAVTCG
jgi:hypothetical protein